MEAWVMADVEELLTRGEHQTALTPLLQAKARASATQAEVHTTQRSAAFAAFLPFVTIFRQMCYYWANVLSFGKCAIFWQMCHLRANVPFMDRCAIYWANVPFLGKCDI